MAFNASSGRPISFIEEYMLNHIGVRLFILKILHDFNTTTIELLPRSELLWVMQDLQYPL